MAVTIAISSDLAQPQSQENLPQTTTLTAVGTDSADGSATFNYSWHIIDKPATSTATLSALVGTSISLAIDLWGSYRVFCIATNLATNETSETNPLQAPLNSFFDIRVESTNYDLEKPSKSQRNWHPQYWHLVDTVEGLNSTPATFLASGDVEIATAADIATVAGPSDSSSGNDYLVVSTEQLSAVLQNNSANGNLTAGQTNTIRNHVKTAALEKMNEVSITELADVDTTTHTPVTNDLLAWDPTATDDSGDGDTGAWVPKSSSELSLGGGGTSAGSQYQIQIADASNGFAAANWSIDSGDDFIPGTNNAFDIGSTGNAVRDIYCDGNLYLGTNGLSVDSNVLKFQSTNSIPHFSGTPGDNQILKYDTAAGGWQLEADVSASGIDGLTSNGSNQLLIDAAYDLDPASTNVHLGSSGNRYGNVYSLDGNFSDDVTVGDNLTVTGFIVLQDYAFLNDDGAAGTLLLTAGDNSSSLSGHIDLTTDEVNIGATTASTAGKLSIVDSSGDKLTLSTQTKQGVSHTILLPAAGASLDQVMYAASIDTNETSLDFATIKQRIVYSTHLSRDIDQAASFTGSDMDSFADDGQACIYWFKNTTGNSITLKQTHIHIGHMKNVSLTFSLCLAADDAAALANTWTQVGSSFQLNNSSGTDNTLGQAQSKQSTSQAIANGEYLGICLTNIPVGSRADKRIVISFECEANVSFA